MVSAAMGRSFVEVGRTTFSFGLVLNQLHPIDPEIVTRRIIFEAMNSLFSDN
jgi:hypothetical protein